MITRILVVEKNSDQSTVLVSGLEKKGYEVAVARTQGQALDRIRVRRPDILVLDVVSFGKNGYRVRDNVRGRLEGVPAILLLEAGHAVAGSDAAAYMFPPFTSKKLLNRVQKLEQNLVRRQMSVSAGPLTLDLEKHTLVKGIAVTPLRPKEEALLALFMRNPGRVLKRQELMRQVWETDYIGDTRTLSVHICWLRTKIEDDPRSPQYLRTVRGVGYRFQVPASNGASTDR